VLPSVSRVGPAYPGGALVPAPVTGRIVSSARSVHPTP